MKHISLFIVMAGTRDNMSACRCKISCERKKSWQSTTLVWLKPEGKSLMGEIS